MVSGFFYLFIFIQEILIVASMCQAGTVLGTEDAVVDKRNRSALMEFIF